MKKILSNKLVIVSYACILVSIISMFTTIVGYTNSNGVYRSFSLFDFWKAMNSMYLYPMNIPERYI